MAHDPGERYRYSENFYTVRALQPEGDNWTTVAEAENIWGGSYEKDDQLQSAAMRFLGHKWPADLSKADGFHGINRREGLAGKAHWRVAVIGFQVDRTYTVGELLLAEVAEHVREGVEREVAKKEAAAALKEARAKYLDAQSMVRVAGYHRDESARNAEAAGVDPAEITKAKRRSRRKAAK